MVDGNRLLVPGGLLNQKHDRFIVTSEFVSEVIKRPNARQNHGLSFQEARRMAGIIFGMDSTTQGSRQGEPGTSGKRTIWPTSAER